MSSESLQAAEDLRELMLSAMRYQFDGSTLTGLAHAALAAIQAAPPALVAEALGWEKHTARHWQVRSVETDGIAFSVSDREVWPAEDARRRAEEWAARFPGYRVEDHEQVWYSMPDVWRRVDPPEDAP